MTPSAEAPCCSDPAPGSPPTPSTRRPERPLQPAPRPPPRAHRSPALRASLLLAGSSAAWGLATVATKGLLAEVPPLTMLVVQLSASTAFLWGAVLLTRTPVRLDRSAALAGLSGVLEPGLAHTVSVVGLSLTSASSASLIGATEAPMIVLLAWLVLRERVGARTVLLALLAGLGVGLLMLPDLQGVGGGTLLGDALVVVATVLAALYVIVTRRLVAGTAPLPLVALQQTAGLLWAVATLGVARALGWAPPLAGLGGTTLLLVAATGVVQFGLSFWLYLAGLRHLPASRAALYLSLIPLFGVAGAAAALGERLAPAQWIGAVVVVAAVQAMVRADRRGAAEEAARAVG
jgi:drug/metabolite transporter (DMT)-like permease